MIDITSSSQPVTLIEPYQHYEVLDSLIRMLLDRKAPITCYTNPFCHKHSAFKESGQVDWNISKAKNIDKLLENNASELAQDRMILFTTIDVFSSFWKNNETENKILGLIHNANAFFDLHDEASNSVKNKLKNTIYSLRGDQQKMRAIENKLDSIIVPAQSIKDHLLNKVSSTLYSKIVALEISYPDNADLRKSTDEIKIVIPGSVDQNRRNYEVLLKVLPELDKEITKSISIVFLGKPKSPKEISIINRLNDLNLNSIKHQFFDSYIDPESFEITMNEASFLFLPILKKTNYKSSIEYRGKTCVTGNINDLVKYKLPAILPSFYPIYKNLLPLVSQYKNELELVQILKDWIMNKSYLEKRANTDSTLAQLKLAVQEQLDTMLSDKV